MLEASICIVSKNRQSELNKTLQWINLNVDLNHTEVLICLDGCSDDSYLLVEKFSYFQWLILQESIGASPARNKLYKRTKGAIIFGFDDDANPVEKGFICTAQNLFKSNPKVGILAFREIRDLTVYNEVQNKVRGEFLCSEFIGCGFAIKREVYFKTNGFPTWMKIYGEESCVSAEVLDCGFDILFSSDLVVLHRVNLLIRKKQGHNQYRFKNQLINSSKFYLVYYPFRFWLYKLGRLYQHNFIKYAVLNGTFFFNFFQAGIATALFVFELPKYRKVLKLETLQKMRDLPAPRI
ncbi:glycosyltransferase family 2 protein [Leeuwenhoekiella sp. LLG6367-2.1]|uniref:glycosyltransferase family 2 protein n=1 Tax=Leeuwenhoekiella sp. LLG6367-2.1 TaxID=3160833 RepID=UPI00386BB6F8